MSQSVQTFCGKRKANFRKQILLSVLLSFMYVIGSAQQMTTPLPGTPVTLQNAPHKDSTNKTNNNQWRDEPAKIYFTKGNSDLKTYPDSSIHFFHRRPFSQPWMRNLGNLGAPSINLFFTPESRVAPTLGYHTFDVYRFHADSLLYFNTTRPFSVFTYQLGSHAEQMAEILHTQNISPRWNFAARYRKINAPGYYNIQRTNHDLANLTSNYISKNQHYALKLALVYNKLQNDENGGILTDSFLTTPGFGDKRTIPVAFQNTSYSTRRSSVTTLQRDFTLLLNHSYTLGKTDTIFNNDSTQFFKVLKPRFRIEHTFRLSTEKYQFKDLAPDSLRYAYFFQQNFQSGDSVFSRQTWFYIDNGLSLQGFIGSDQKGIQFFAGIGNRFDRFRTEYITGSQRQDEISNYIFGGLKKDAKEAGQWLYSADAKLFFTGMAAGDFIFKANVGKEFKSGWGNIQAGFQQSLNTAPYSYTLYANQYFKQSQTFTKESQTRFQLSTYIPDLKVSAALNSYLIANYIYINPILQFDQYAPTFNLTQISAKKVFTWKQWILDNELAFQQKTINAPINIPTFMGRHQLSLETKLFGNALKIATGLDFRWHSAYQPAGYEPFFNRFYFQNTYNLTNAPEVGLFFNFKVKSFRAFVMGDQLQKLFGARNIISAPGYPAQDAMLRMGFSWDLVN
ncbi:MAG: hypothetical protein JST52_08275 [Bacteroidetes bacterium]|nr:hypothetical protein [Bacteroidota bacterium]MBS1739884.1 hypothetical protein [Bacteroidota bacterium]